MERRALFEDELKQAGDALEEANILFKEGFWKGSSSRAYYSVFHATKSLLILLGFDPRSHEGTRSLFGKEVVRRGMTRKEFAKIYSTLYKLRDVSDYRTAEAVTRDDAFYAITSAKKFLNEIKGIVEKID